MLFKSLMPQKNLFVSFVIAALAAVAPLSMAHADLKIAVVNVPRLLEEAPQAKAAMGALQNEFAPRQRDIVTQQKELQTKDDKLQKDSAVMAENERRTAENEVREGQRDLTRKQNEYMEDLNLRRNEELGKLQRSLLQEVQAFAKTGGYDLVLGDGVLFAKETIDITPQVLSALQQRYKPGAAAPAPATSSPKK